VDFFVTCYRTCEHSNVRRGKEREELKKRFEMLCRKLTVDPETAGNAWNLVCAVPAEDNVSDPPPQSLLIIFPFYILWNFGDMANTKVVEPRS
jgi:hypothetical protein